MIITSKLKDLSIQIPTSTTKKTGNFVLRFLNTVSGSRIEESVFDTNRFNYFYEFVLTEEFYQRGEYQFVLLCDDIITEVGLLRIESEEETKSHNININTVYYEG